MARIPYPTDVDPDLVESQRPDSLPDRYAHLEQQAARNVYRSVAHEPELVEALRGFIGAAWEHAGLSDRERELVILALAREVDAAYEWHQHVRIAILEGIDPEEILAVARNDPGPFSQGERALMEYARAAATTSASDEDVERLASAHSPADIAGITSLVGAYVGLAVILDALDVETEEPFVGWDLEGLERD
ncbi:MAG: carboxymuconolactone decarboxylase family protein [Halanaeroarchaeum sp.]